MVLQLLNGKVVHCSSIWWITLGKEILDNELATRLVPQYFVLVVVIAYMVNLVHQTGGGEVVARITGDT